jgi:hypothetical protein
MKIELSCECVTMEPRRTISRTRWGITMAPHIVKAMALIGVKRRAGAHVPAPDQHDGNPDRLPDHRSRAAQGRGHSHSSGRRGLLRVSESEIRDIDSDGAAVYALVMEVTIRGENGSREPKTQYLRRIMTEGSPRARLLKLADRISNLTALGFVNDVAFVRRYLEETKTSILPYAEAVNADMFRELSDLVSSREHQPSRSAEAQHWRPPRSSQTPR